MYGALHSRDSVARIYLPRKKGGRGLISVEDCVDQAVISLSSYIAHSNEMLLTAARGNLDSPHETSKEFRKRKTEERMREAKEKQLHGQFLRDMEGVASEKSWEWLEKCHLKKSTEGLIMAAQSQSLRTNAIKTKIDKTKNDPSCRLCKKNDETVNHLLSECPKLAQTEYKRRHDSVAKGIHWDLCKHYGVECGDKWYEHIPKPVVESSDVKILWDFTIQTDKKLPHNKPDIVVVEKTSRTCHIIDVACPGDRRIRLKEEEKINKYRDLTFEVKRLWKLKKATTTPIVIGALGTYTDRLEKYLEDIHVGLQAHTMQKTVLLGSARILRQVLDC